MVDAMDTRGYSLFFVLNGLLNGERGTHPARADGLRLGEGWYYMIDDVGDFEGQGPYRSRDDAEEAAEAAMSQIRSEMAAD